MLGISPRTRSTAGIRSGLGLAPAIVLRRKLGALPPPFTRKLLSQTVEEISPISLPTSAYDPTSRSCRAGNKSAARLTVLARVRESGLDFRDVICGQFVGEDDEFAA